MSALGLWEELLARRAFVQASVESYVSALCSHLSCNVLLAFLRRISRRAAEKAKRLLTSERRQSEADLPLRLSGLPSVLRPTRSLREAQGTTHGSWLAIAAQGHVHAELESHCDSGHGEQERHEQQNGAHEEFAYGMFV